MSLNFITVKTIVKKPLADVWTMWTDPKHIVCWNFASPDWHTTKATNDLRDGGKFSSTMAAKDGSMQFDFEGKHDKVVLHKNIQSTLDDGRKMEVQFTQIGDETNIIEKFQPESENPIELQEAGWQAILTNFKQYAEAQ